MRSVRRPARSSSPSPRCWPTFWVSSEVPVDSHFFDDLGADSLVMAQFCARVRKRPDLPSVSMKDVYQHPTISSLAGGAVAPTRDAARSMRRPSAPVEPAARPGAARRAVRPLRGAAVPDLPRRTPTSPPWSWRWATSGSPPARVCSTSTCGRSCSAAPRFLGRVPAADPGEVGARSAGGSRRRDPRLEPGVRPLLDRQDAGPVQPAGPAVRRARRCTCCTCGRWARRSAAASRSSPSTCRCAPTCSPSATARSSARTSFFPGYRAHAGADPDRPGHPRQGRRSSAR